MNSAVDEELRSLRSRAYGPGSDIDRDPAAIQRLHELEEALRTSPVEASIPPIPAMTVAPDEPAPTRVGDNHESGPADQAVADGVVTADDVADATVIPPGRRATVGRLTKLLWAMSLVVSAALAASVTWAVVWMSPVSVSAGAPQVATLEATSTVELPSGFLGAGPSSAVFEFAGLTIFESTNGFGAGIAGNPCITVLRTEQVPSVEDFDPSSWGFSGQIHAGCRVGSFPATVQLPFTSDLPEELSARFPSGTAVQFVLDHDGEKVGVFVDSE